MNFSEIPGALPPFCFAIQNTNPLTMNALMRTFVYVLFPFGAICMVLLLSPMPTKVSKYTAAVVEKALRLKMLGLQFITFLTIISGVALACE